MINPYLCYAFSFVVAIVTYLLGWSDLYPELSLPLLAFLVITICFHVYLGTRILRPGNIFTSIAPFSETGALRVTLFVYALWVCEFLYAGGIPLMKLLLNQPYNYRTFGIPSLHVFIVTFSSFYTVFLFHLYRSSRRRIILVLYLVNLFAAILIYNRGMFLFNLSSSFFLLLMSVNRIPRVWWLVLPVSLAVLLYLFGVLGSLRVSREARKPYTTELFMQTGRANHRFVTSHVPREYFWAYIYISSPLANLQHTVNTKDAGDASVGKLAEMINNELLLDFISKRINTRFHLEPEKENTIPGPFNVSTVYARSFSYWGWAGMFLMACAVAAIPWLYRKILPETSPFFLSGFSILCTMFLFLAFDNTIRFTGFSFQLLYPFLLHFLSKKFPETMKFFVNNKVTNP